MSTEEFGNLKEGQSSKRNQTYIFSAKFHQTCITWHATIDPEVYFTTHVLVAAR